MSTTTTISDFAIQRSESERESLSTPLTLSTRFKVELQRTVGWLLLLPFTGFIVFLMRVVRGYTIQDRKELRAYFRSLTAKKEPLLICANHLTFIDSAILIWALSSNTNYFLSIRRFPWNLPAGDFFKKKFIFRVVAYLAKCIFIHRDGTKEHKNGILGICHHLLKRGEIVTLFPEGRRSRTGVFDKDRITFGVGKLLKSIPECRVLCVYLRGDKQRGFSNYPPKNSSFKILMDVIIPKTEKTGKEAYFELASQVADKIQGLEQKYLDLTNKDVTSLMPIKKTALITGASEGIGRALSAEFANAGYDLVLVARNEERLKSLATECESKFGARTTILPIDLSHPTSIEKIAEKLAENKISIDTLVNNAGFGVHGKFTDTPIEEELKLLHLQIQSVVALTKKVLPAMVERKNGNLLNVASVYSFSPVPQQAIYSASKAFMLSFSESIAHEVKAHGISVSIVCPGVTHTEFRKRANIREKEKSSGMTPKQVAQAALKGLNKKQRIIVPGRVNQVFVGVVKHLPGQMATKLLHQINTVRNVN